MALRVGTVRGYKLHHREGSFSGLDYEHSDKSKIHMPALSMWLFCKSMGFVLLQ